MTTQSEVAAASKANRAAVNKVGETFGVVPVHTRSPVRDLDDLLGQVKRKHDDQLWEAIRSERRSRAQLEALQQQLLDTCALLDERDRELAFLKQTAKDAIGEAEELRDAAEYERERANALSFRLHLARATIAEQKSTITALKQSLANGDQRGNYLSVVTKGRRTFLPRLFFQVFGVDTARVH